MIALVLKEFRRLKNITQSELANSLNVTREYLIDIENGNAGITDDYLIKWGEFFGIELDKIKNYSIVVKPNESKFMYILRTTYRYRMLKWTERRNKKLGRY